MAELAARSLHDRKVVGSNTAGSNSDRLVSLTRIDGYIVSDKYNMEFPEVLKKQSYYQNTTPPSKGVIPLNSCPTYNPDQNLP